MSDTPKAGEVWEYKHTSGECTIVGTPDTYGWCHVTSVDLNGDLRNSVINVAELCRKPAAPPSDVGRWTNYYPWGNCSAPDAAEADRCAHADRTWRFDAYGNWVPCQGKTVIGPAVKGRP